MTSGPLPRPASRQLSVSDCICNTPYMHCIVIHALNYTLLQCCCQDLFKKLETKTKTSGPWSRDQDQDLGSLVSRPRPIKFHFKCNKCIHTHSSTFCCTVQCTSNSLQYYTNQCPLSTACKLLSLSNIRQPL